MTSANAVAEEYRVRLRRWQGEHASHDRLYRRLGNARLATGVAGAAIAAASLGGEWIAAWWLLLPLAALPSHWQSCTRGWTQYWQRPPALSPFTSAHWHASRIAGQVRDGKASG